MTIAIPFRTIVHADWSTSPRKRWAVTADRTDNGWRVAAPRRVGELPALLDSLFSADGPALAGFDFPIGMPRSYGLSTGLEGFAAAVGKFGHGEWADFYRVAEIAEHVSPRRPFYPRVSTKAARQVNLLVGLGVENVDALRRQCERATATRRAACPLFWTLGGNQVGKAAISGWQDVIVPAQRRGAKIWPFDGPLATLAADSRAVIAETYPAEAYGHVGMRFRPGMSKQRQIDRQVAMADLVATAASHRVVFSENLTAMIANGFGTSKSGEDPFDALAGALGMIEVIEGRRAEGPEVDDVDEWEGWIMGQAV